MNIYDIADKAGVSIATVSRVINNDKKVSKSTRDRVQKIIEDNNFIKKSDYSRHTNNTRNRPNNFVFITIIFKG